MSNPSDAMVQAAATITAALIGRIKAERSTIESLNSSNFPADAAKLFQTVLNEMQRR
ncbi:hypothetical protein [Stenotrophomonas indicatrix]|uniref:hypothetical protein n=1 Tax=Stenotrophomonas indicatrix TaxID=2045451 RepID=UPI0028AA06C6|nr:hypothetical protein [Stenotrophomonas indicatrix]